MLPEKTALQSSHYQAVGYVLVKANRSQMMVSQDISAWEQCKELGVWILGLADMIAERN